MKSPSEKPRMERRAPGQRRENGESGERRVDKDDVRARAAEEMAALERDYADDAAFDPRLALLTLRESAKREAGERRQERDEFAAQPIWTNDTPKELRKPYEVRHGKELEAWEGRIKESEDRAQGFADMLAALGEGDPSAADRYFLPREEAAAKKLHEHERDLRIAKSAAEHPEAHLDWTKLENLTRMATAAERNVRLAQKALRKVQDQRRFLRLLALTKN
jgi:hypothetical protein